MKTTSLFTLFGMVTLLIIISCVNEDDYTTPDINLQNPNIPQDKITTFNTIKARLEQAQANGNPTAVIPLEEELYIEGYVVSSDKSGNFFEELIIQNKTDDSNPENDPRLGFRISVNVPSLYNTFEFGRKVYVKLSGLNIGIANGVLVIGKGNSSQIQQIQASEYRDIIIRTPEVVTIIPKITNINDLGEQDENTFVQLNNMQFNRNQLALSYAGEPADDFDGFRTLENCDNLATILLQTSTFSDFKSLQVAPGKGIIEGVFSRDFADDFNVLIINTAADIIFDSTERCDPNVLECNDSFDGTDVIFSQNFENITLSQLEQMGWLNQNVSGDNLKYVIGNFSNNNYVQISGFNSGAIESSVWLVTPTINLDDFSTEYVTFDLEVAYANGVILTTFITDNFTGDIATTTWTEMDINIPNTPASSFGGFNNVGNINVSCLEGDIRVGFRYISTDPTATTRYHIDNFKILGKKK